MNLHHGDCLDVMAGMEPESVDAIVTDPPYGLEFMGKEWDRLVADMPNAAAWAGRRGTKRMEKGDEETGPTNPWGKESTGYRGGERHGSKRCRVCGRRQFSGTPCQCETPDWEVVYPKGAPSGAVAMGRWHERWAEAAFRVAKPSSYLLAFGGTRTVHRMTVALEDAGWIIRDMLVWAYASGFPKSKASLKPAWEPIVMARKPGPLRMLAIDECRIGIDDAERETIDNRSGGQSQPSLYGMTARQHGERVESAPAGRWPANVILTDPIFDGGWDGVVGGGETASGSRSGEYNGSASWTGEYGPVSRAIDGDSGTYSRFFLIPKADRTDREPVLGGLPERDDPFAGTAHSKWCRTCGKQAVNVPGSACECAGPDWTTTAQRKRANHHPTVKPVDLMRHLVRLVTPTGGVVLDPFLGSGTTAIAAEMEGFEWIGIEKEAEYVAIAEARLNGTQRGMGLVG